MVVMDLLYLIYVLINGQLNCPTPLQKAYKQGSHKLHVYFTHQCSSDKMRRLISLYLIKQGCKIFDSVLKMLKKNIQS